MFPILAFVVGVILAFMVMGLTMAASNSDDQTEILCLEKEIALRDSAYETVYNLLDDKNNEIDGLLEKIEVQERIIERVVKIVEDLQFKIQS